VKKVREKRHGINYKEGDGKPVLRAALMGILYPSCPLSPPPVG